MTKVKIIGAGSIGAHLAQASRRIGWDVVVTDVSPEALARFRNNLYPSRYGAWDPEIKLFLHRDAPVGGFDVICIGTPPDVRLPIAVSALRENPRVLQLEKPLCSPLLTGLSDFTTAYAKSQNTNVIVGYDHALATAIDFIVRHIQMEIFGRILSINVHFREHWQGIFKAHPWLSGPQDTYLGFWRRGGGAGCEHSHALHLWLYLAQVASFGTATSRTILPVMNMVKTDQCEYDQAMSINFVTNGGLVGSVVQDVITQPTRKWVRVQGSAGYIEWLCNGHPDGDLVRWSSQHVTDGQIREEVFKKSRTDDFYNEILHIQALLRGEINPFLSPVSLESGIEVMKILHYAYAQNGNKMD